MPGPLKERIVSFRQKRCRTRHEQAHIGDQILVKLRMGQKAGIEGRNPHHNGRIRQAFHHVIGIEFRKQDHLAAIDQHDIDRNKQTMRVK